MDESKLPPLEWVVVEKTCAHCDGTGRIGALMEDMCGECHASGYTKRYVSLERLAEMLTYYIAHEASRAVRIPPVKSEKS